MAGCWWIGGGPIGGSVFGCWWVSGRPVGGLVVSGSVEDLSVGQWLVVGGGWPVSGR